MPVPCHTSRLLPVCWPDHFPSDARPVRLTPVRPREKLARFYIQRLLPEHAGLSGACARAGAEGPLRAQRRRACGLTVADGAPRGTLRYPWDTPPEHGSAVEGGGRCALVPFAAADGGLIMSMCTRWTTATGGPVIDTGFDSRNGRSRDSGQAMTGWFAGWQADHPRDRHPSPPRPRGSCRMAAKRFSAPNW